MNTKTPKKPKKLTQSQLKKKADEVFSRHIRLKYAWDNEYVRCYTCGKVKHYKSMQCGHFISRACLALRYDERNCRVQCAGCNLFGNGQIAKFGSNLETENPGITSVLYRESQRICHDFPYQEIIQKYGQKQM